MLHNFLPLSLCNFIISLSDDLHLFPLSQVSTWFANARRRLKKENKVTWSPRACKSSDDRGCDDDSDEAEKPLKSDKDLPGEWGTNPCRLPTFSSFMVSRFDYRAQT